MHTTNYRNAFISVSPDCPAATARAPDKPGTVAAIQYRMMTEAPGALTSDDVIFATHAQRAGIPDADRAQARAAFFSRGQACLRASPLVKTHGWGVLHDGAGRVTLVPRGSAEYDRLSSDPALAQFFGMRAKRG